MRVHAIQTGTVAIKSVQREGSQQGNPLFNLFRDKTWTEPLPIYAYLIEHPEGLILVDTGETARSSRPGYWPRWHPYYRFLAKTYVSPSDEIGNQLQVLGFLPEEVHTVITTHFHTDHMGGLQYFPKAKHFASSQEYRDATRPLARLNGSLSHLWPSWYQPTLIEFEAKQVGPFPKSFTLTKANDVHILPTPGHTAGHISVLLKTDKLSFFLASDVSYTQALMLKQQPDGVSFEKQKAKETLKRVRDYCLSTPTLYLPSHDPDVPERLRLRQVVSSS